MNKELIYRIHQREPWNEALSEPLQSLAFCEPETAWKDLIALAGHAHFEKLYPDFFQVLLEKLPAPTGMCGQMAIAWKLTIQNWESKLSISI